MKIERIKKFFTVLLAYILTAFLLLAAIPCASASGTSSPDTGSAAAADNRKAEDKKIRNILLIGVDNDNVEGLSDLGNADGILLISISDEAGSISAVSFMRDIKYKIDDRPSSKLTLSYQLGGPEFLVEVIEKSFDIDIDNYVVFNYLNIIDIFDYVGAIEVDLSEAEILNMNWKIENLDQMLGVDTSENKLDPAKPGLTKLNSVQTVAYMRIRDAGNDDYDRTARIRTVVSLLKENVKSMKFTDMYKLAALLISEIKTDLSWTDMAALAFNGTKMMKYDLTTARIPADGTFSESEDYGVSYLVIDYEKNTEYLHSLIYANG